MSQAIKLELLQAAAQLAIAQMEGIHPAVAIPVDPTFKEPLLQRWIDFSVDLIKINHYALCVAAGIWPSPDEAAPAPVGPGPAPAPVPAPAPLVGLPPAAVGIAQGLAGKLLQSIAG